MDVIGALAIAICATARLAIASLVHFGETEIDERVDIAVGDSPDGPALAAIAAIGTAERPEFFTAERCAAVAAIARDDFDFCFVDKLHNFAAIKLKRLYLGQSLSIEGLRLTSCDHGGANWRSANELRWYCFVWYNGHELLRASTFDNELHFASDQREQSVVLAHAYAFAGAHWGAALTNDDAASIDSLAAVDFNAQTL